MGEVPQTELRSTDLPVMWKKFYQDMAMDENEYDIMVSQLANDSLFKELIRFHCPTDVAQAGAQQEEMSELEENIIRYASGYVPYSLIKQFKRRKEEKFASFIDCLISMSVNCNEPIEESFYDYTKKWTTITNRGGLFEINDLSFRLFKAIETVLRSQLSSSLLKSASDNKKCILDGVTSNENVLFHWSLLAVDIENEENSSELLTHIVQLWLTIRGYSLTNEWVERYKMQKRTSIAKEKGLRKSLRIHEKNDILKIVLL